MVRVSLLAQDRDRPSSGSLWRSFGDFTFVPTALDSENLARFRARGPPLRPPLSGAESIQAVAGSLGFPVACSIVWWGNSRPVTITHSPNASDGTIPVMRRHVPMGTKTSVVRRYWS